jgi:hypothetical protein
MVSPNNLVLGPVAMKGKLFSDLTLGQSAKRYVESDFYIYAYWGWRMRVSDIPHYSLAVGLGKIEAVWEAFKSRKYFFSEFYTEMESRYQK